MDHSTKGSRPQEGFKKSYSFKLIENDSIIFCKVRGRATREVVEGIVQDGQKYVDILRSSNKPALLLVDISELTSIATSARRSVKIIQNFKPDKTAIYGGNQFLSMIIKYIYNLSKVNKRNRVFKTKNQALRWFMGREKSFEKTARITSARILSLIIMSIGLIPLVGKYTNISSLQSFGFSTGAIDPMLAVNLLLIGISIMLLTRKDVKKAIKIFVRTLGTWLVFFGFWRIISNWTNATDTDALLSWPFTMLFVFLGLLLWQVTYPLTYKIYSNLFRATTIITVVWTFGLLFADVFDFPFSSRLVLDVIVLAAAIAIVLVAYHKPGRFPVAHFLVSRFWPGIVTFFIIFLIALFAWGSDRENIEQANLYRTKQLLAPEFNSRIEVLQSYQAFFDASEFVEENEFNKFTSQLNIQERYAGITSVIIVGNTASDNYHFLYPSKSTVTDYNFATHPELRMLLERARDSGKIESDVIYNFPISDSVQESISAIAIYNPNFDTPQTLDRRRSELQGFVLATFNPKIFLQDFFESHPVQDGVLLTITNADTGEIYYQTSNMPPNNPPPIIAKSSAKVGEETWTVNILKNNFGTGNFLSSPNVYLPAGILISIFAALTVNLLVHRRFQVQKLVDTIIKDLEHEQNLAMSLAQEDEAIIESIGDGLVVTNQVGKVIRINNKFEVMTGYSAKDFMGKKLVDVIPLIDTEGSNIPKSKRLINQVLPAKNKKVKSKKMAKATLKDKLQYKRKDGTHFPVAITATPVVVDNKIVGAIQVIRDITQEAQIDQAKTEFVSLASHQLRTPLTATKWYSELLLDGEAGHLNTKQQKYTQETLNGTNRTIALVNALLNVSRVEVGSVGVYTELTDITKLAAKIVKNFSERAYARHIKISEKYKSNLPKMQVDPKILQTIIENLLSNAIKYTPKNGSVALNLNKEPIGIIISVSDTGYGIPKAQQDKIFTKLFRADNVRLKSTEGTGLGLYLAKALADYSGCKMWFTSTENKGSTFYVLIPNKGMERRRGTSEIVSVE